MMHSNKWISSALVLSLSVGLSACGKANDKKKGNNSGASSTASSVLACEEAFIKDSEIYIEETINQSTMITQENSSKIVEELTAKYESMMSKYVGHPDCSVAGEEGTKQTIKFPKNQDELKTKVAEKRKELEEMAKTKSAK
jgi:hypothetical protein